jgi:hypothetical protein
MSLLHFDWAAEIIGDFSYQRVIRKLINTHLQTLRFLYGKRSVSLDYWFFYRSLVQKLFRSPDPLFSNHSQTTGAFLPVEELVDLLFDDVLGGWALDGETISFLWRMLQRERPKVIIECGAEVSTLIFAKSLAINRFGSTDFTSVVSLEQNLAVKKAVERRLERCGLQQGVTVFHSPASNEGEYQFEPNELREHLGLEKVDWLVIDGPAGPDGCRASTLPYLARFCRPGARWFLDDAFRDGELEILNEWNGLRGIVVDGIYPIGKGLAAGIVADPGSLSVNSS